MAADLVSLAIRSIVDSRFEPGPTPTVDRRLQILHKVEEYVESFSSQSFRIPDICHHVGVSERSLRYAFEDLAGLSPAAYLKAHRLSRVHSTLLEAEPNETLIETIAYEHSFWHLGQFSQDYRLAFGERPSETLARAARHGASSRLDSVFPIRS
jgi:AraC family ethanolamine operon transcriptional activator